MAIISVNAELYWSGSTVNYNSLLSEWTLVEPITFTYNTDIVGTINGSSSSGTRLNTKILEMYYYNQEQKRKIGTYDLATAIAKYLYNRSGSYRAWSSCCFMIRWTTEDYTFRILYPYSARVTKD